MVATDPTRAVFDGTIGIGGSAMRRPTDARLDVTFQKGAIQHLMRKIAGILAGILLPMFALAVHANAVPLISNGGFETGLTGWAVTSSAGSGGSWFPDTGFATPLTGNPTVGPHSGTGYAVTDQFGPGVNALSQNYTVPVGTTSLTLTFDMFVNDWNSSIGTADVEALILGAGGNPVTASGTTLTSVDTQVVGGVPNPYIAYSFPVPFVAGNSYILDYRETDTTSNMNVGVDDVSLNATVAQQTPEPRSVALLLAALAVMGVFSRRRLGAIRHQGKLLAGLAAIALLSQPVHAQNPTGAYALVPPSAIGPGEARPYVWRMGSLATANAVHGPGVANCSETGVACFYFPVDIQTGYTTGFIKNANGGRGITIGIVDAFFNSQIVSDLTNFNTTYGLPQLDGVGGDGTLTILGQTCGAPPAQPPGPPFADSIPADFTETDLDVQWAHAMAPFANIVLVIANSLNFSDIIPAEACAISRADVVTNSFGAPEFPGENSLDFAWSATIPILFSAGDAFLLTQYPCASPNVTCVGGTNLLETSTSHRNRESVWNEPITDGGTGGGCSVLEPEPAFQSGFSTCGSARGTPDIAAIADPYSGVVVYLGTNANNGGPAGIGIIGGTSLASPVMAGVIADIDASRVAAGKAILGGTAPFNLGTQLYPAAASPFYHYRYYDVTVGTDAAAGWDIVTGLGVTLNPALTSYLNSLP